MYQNDMYWGTDTAQILCSFVLHHSRFALSRWTSTRRPITPQGHWDVNKAEEMNANKNVKIVVLHVHATSYQLNPICHDKVWRKKKIRNLFASTINSKSKKKIIHEQASGRKLYIYCDDVHRVTPTTIANITTTNGKFPMHSSQNEWLKRLDEAETKESPHTYLRLAIYFILYTR